MRSLVIASMIALTMGCASHVQSLRVFQPVAAQPVDKAKLVALAPQLDALLAEKFNAAKATGLVAGFVLDGELVYARALGTRDASSQRPVDFDSLFRMASLTKSFTAMAIMKLRDEGKLALDAPVSTYLPELTTLSLPTHDATPMTARALLTHTAGLPDDNMWGAVSFGMADDELRRLLQAGVSFAHVPGTEYEYSNLGYALLGKLIERVSGMHFRDYITTNILRPLGMHSAAWASSIATAPPANLAIGYWGEQEPLTEAPRLSDGVFESAGGLYVSLHDYARYTAFQLAAYPPRDEPEAGPIRRSSLREMHQGHRVARTPGANDPVVQRSGDEVELWGKSYGFGWSNIITCTEEPRVQHAGWEPGYFSVVTLLPQHRLGIIMLATSHSIRAMTAMLDLIRAAGALPPAREPPANPSLVDAQRGITSLLASWDAALVARIFDPQSHYYPWFQGLPETLAKARREHGHCEPDGSLHPLSRLHGRFRLRCERGAVDIDVALTPATPARVTLVEMQHELPPNERLGELAQRLTAAIGGDHAALESSLFAPALDQHQLHKALAHAAINHGTCVVDRPLAGDGQSSAVLLLRCTEGQLELALGTDQAGQITSFELREPRTVGAPCWQ